MPTSSEMSLTLLMGHVWGPSHRNDLQLELESKIEELRATIEKLTDQISVSAKKTPRPGKEKLGALTGSPSRAVWEV